MSKNFKESLILAYTFLTKFKDKVEKSPDVKRMVVDLALRYAYSASSLLDDPRLCIDKEYSTEYKRELDNTINQLRRYDWLNKEMSHTWVLRLRAYP